MKELIERVEAKQEGPDVDELAADLKRMGSSLEEYVRFIVELQERQENAGSSQGPGIELVRLASIASVPLRWLWPAKIPAGKLALLVGDPGLGKSVITLDLAARVTIGAPWPDGSSNGDPGDVIILSAEDDPADTIRPRLEIVGANLDRIFILRSVKRQDGHRYAFSLVDDLLALRECLNRLGSAVRLIIIDPISAYLGDIDSHVNTSVRAVLAPLAELAATSGVTTLGVSHLNKGQGVAIYRIQGSIAFVASARAVWAVGKDPKDETGRQRLFLPVKMNLAPEVGGISYTLDDCDGIVAVHWGDQVSADASDVMGPAEELSAKEEAMRWLEDYLADGPAPAKEILKAASDDGISKNTLYRASTTLKVEKSKTGYRSGWTWTLSKIPNIVEDPQDIRGRNLGDLGDTWVSSEDGQKELIEDVKG